MQAIANEMNFSETTFVLPAERADTDVRLRIFTPANELPMAGHPTIGSAFALARAGVIAAGREQFVFGLGVGPTPVALTWRGADLSFAWMTQPNPTFADPVADRAAVAAALVAAGDGTGRRAAGAGRLVRRAVSLRAAGDARAPWTPPPRCRRCSRRCSRSTGSGAHGVFIFSPEPAPDGGDRATVYSRMFAPELGVIEDPATGSASGPLGCYLVRHQLVAPEAAGAMLSLQGVEDGPAEPRPHLDRRGARRRSRAFGLAAKPCSRAKACCTFS